MRDFYKATVNTVGVEHGDFKFRVIRVRMGVFSCHVVIDHYVGEAVASGFTITNFITANFIELEILTVFPLIRMCPSKLG